ncbi:L-histidine N(alpha)-methyltransferase [Streptomyces prunicolor]|uniref:L-histidine N(alpha)-methyltransferase n=1 Tax=Streptomyces prunicolor TaxID=67348 RepID=UPI00131A0611|nr:L-histidine N(alpha)-methyltransferase [Streptomyces prunicolor]
MAAHYFTKQEITDTYGVSVPTVTNWIRSTKNGKLDLELFEQGSKTYVIRSAKNVEIIKRLVDEGKKYRPRHSFKEITPRDEFYNTYTEGQVYDIVVNLEKYREVDCELNYFDGGAENWDKYVQRLATEDSSNITETVKLLGMSTQFLDELAGEYDKVNIIDIGVGNAMPVRGLIEHYLESKKLGRYVGLDISREMLDIAGRNIKQWFGGTVQYDAYELDIKRERFGHLLAEDYLKDERVANIVLFLGGTSNNFRDPDEAFRTISESLRKDDIFIYTSKLDTDNTRSSIDFSAGDASNTLMDPIVRFVFDLLNIDEKLYEVDKGYDEELRQRYLRIRLTSAVTMTFEFGRGKQVLEFNKGDRILFWRAWHMTPKDVYERLERNGFYMLNANQNPDRQYVLTVSQIKQD